VRQRFEFAEPGEGFRQRINKNGGKVKDPPNTLVGSRLHGEAGGAAKRSQKSLKGARVHGHKIERWVDDLGERGRRDLGVDVFGILARQFGKNHLPKRGRVKGRNQEGRRERARPVRGDQELIKEGSGLLTLKVQSIEIYKAGNYSTEERPPLRGGGGDDQLGTLKSV